MPISLRSPFGDTFSPLFGSCPQARFLIPLLPITIFLRISSFDFANSFFITVLYSLFIWFHYLYRCRNCMADRNTLVVHPRRRRGGLCAYNSLGCY